jgi:hypothetical protein
MTVMINRSKGLSNNLVENGKCRSRDVVFPSTQDDISPTSLETLLGHLLKSEVYRLTPLGNTASVLYHSRFTAGKHATFPSTTPQWVPAS